MNLLDTLRYEKEHHRKGGLYRQTQISFAYNSNRIEGNQLTHEQTRYIYETHSFLSEKSDQIIRTDDIIETLSHFRAFDYLLDIAEQPLTEEIIKTFHAILKRGTSDEADPNFNVGGYKKSPNMIGETVYTASPEEVPGQMTALLSQYHSAKAHNEADIILFHYLFEKIHPFQDGNGRVGRLVMFKECLLNGLVPWVIDENHKLYYYRGLKNYPQEPGYLTDTCLSAQDTYQALMNYFRIDQSLTSEPSIEPN